MNIYHVRHGSILPLGKQGENMARKIQFDISRWIGTFGPGTVQLLHQRSGDEAPYPVAVEQAGNLAVWTVTSADTAAAGTGYAELQYYVGDALAKSETWMTKVLPALGDAGETPPEAQQGWVDQVLQAGTVATEAADRAEEAAVRQPYPNAETGTWWVWNAESGAYEDTGISYGTGGSGGLTVTNTAAVGQTIKVSAVDENGQPTEWESVDMPEQVQADWNQNDETTADYVKNRPFYLKNPVEKAIFDYSFSLAATGFICESFDGYSIGLVDGEEYIVTISDFKFSVTAYSDEDGTIYIGNGDAALNKNTEFDGDVPFGCADIKNEGYIFVLSMPWIISSGIISKPDDIVITKIIGSVKEPVKIDEHFLPVAKETERGIVSKVDIKDSVTDRFGFEIDVGDTTYKALTDYLSKYCFPKIGVVFNDISSSRIIFLVEDWIVNIGNKCMIQIKGNSISETNINELYLSFPIDENIGKPAEDALLSSVEYGAPKAILLKANTKTFKITVDDGGTIIATEA